MILTRLIVICAIAGCLASTLNAAAKKVKPVVITVSTDRPDALYKCGEQAKFSVSIKDDKGQLIKQGQAEVILTLDGLKELDKKLYDLADFNPLTISGTLEEPGFLRMRCNFNLDKKSYFGLGAAGYDPLKITPGTPEPPDFDEFWKNAREQLAKLPLDVKLDELKKYSDDKQTTYKISFANISNTRIYGFLSIPKGKGLYPAIVSVPGAGPGYNTPTWVSTWGKTGVIALLMNVHSYDPYVSRQELLAKYKALNKKKVYCLQGAPDRDRFFFKKSILGISRAIDYVASRPEFDKKHFVIYGSSQGGAHALILTGLNKHLTAAISNVPALCDHGGYLKNRMPGWPKLLISYKKQEECLKMSGYFDAVNFARRITVPTIVSVGFIDRTCSPSSVYAAYNQIKGPKKIFNEPLMGHSMARDFIKFFRKWDKGQLGLAKPVPPCN